MGTIKGNSGNNNLVGTPGNDLLIGYSGKDTLNGGTGNDTLNGGEGDDTYIVDSMTDTIIEYSGGGAHDLVKSSVSYTLGNYLNDLTLTGTKAINGTGNSYNNIIRGNDTNNILDGKSGIDTLIGGKGNDTYIVDSTTDTIIEFEGGGSRDLVESSVSYALGGWLNDLTLTGISAINGTGNEVDNIIIGNSADNTLRGDAGNDTIYGVSGDRLFGETGNDVLYGGDYLGGGSFMYGGDGNDLLLGVVSTLYGDNGDDTLDGDYSALYGGNGNDVLIANNANATGGSGNDTITTNFGLNGVYFNTLFEGVDTIKGFLVDDDFGDSILVSASGFGGGLSAGSTIASAQFHIGTAAVDGTDRFIYNTNTGSLFFDVDGLNGTGQVLFATLVGAPAITNENIIVF